MVREMVDEKSRVYLGEGLHMTSRTTSRVDTSTVGLGGLVRSAERTII